MTYRISRNFEASILDFLTEQLNLAWSGISVEKTFSRIYDISLPSVCVRLSDSIHNKAEVGGDSTIRTALVLINIFAENDGQRLDLKDYIVEKVRAGIPYYEYTISGAVVQTKTQNGRIRVLNIDDTPEDFEVDKNLLNKTDRNRHLITLSISLGKVESC